MIVGRLMGLVLAVLVGVSATGCATTSMAGTAAARPDAPAFLAANQATDTIPIVMAYWGGRTG